MAIRERLVGAWSLETYTELPVDGSPSVHPSGKRLKASSCTHPTALCLRS